MPALLRLIAQRLALGVGTLFVVSLLIFGGTQLLPGDVAEAILGQVATPDALAAIRAELNLDRPAYIRYAEWLGNFVQGDFGMSLANRQPIAEMIGGRLGNTLFLAGVAAVVAVPIAILLGLIAARFRETWIDKAISIATLSAISMPEFFIGYMLIFIFAVKLLWAPSIASVYDGMSLGQTLAAVALPVATLALVVVAHMMRMTRASVINVMSSPYIEMAELKGVSRSRIIFRHALPNALSPIINVVVLNLAYLVVGVVVAHMMRMTRASVINVMSSPYIEMAELKGVSRSRIIFRHALPNALSPIINVVVLNLAYLVVGVVVVEVVFVYPGMGQLMVDAVAKRDVPVVQACGLIFAATYVLLNLTADILSIVANPRLRHPR